EGEHGEPGACPKEHEPLAQWVEAVRVSSEAGQSDQQPEHRRRRQHPWLQGAESEATHATSRASYTRPPPSVSAERFGACVRALWPPPAAAAAADYEFETCGAYALARSRLRARARACRSPAGSPRGGGRWSGAGDRAPR